MKQAAPASVPTVDSADPGRLHLIGGGMLLLIALLGAIGIAALLRASALSDARRNLDRFAAGVAEQTSRSLQAVDLALQDAAQRTVTLSAGSGAAMEGEAVNRLLRDRLQTVPQLEAISVISASGRAINISRGFPLPPIDVADRDFFVALRDGARQPFISRPSRSRVSGEWTVFMARRLPAPEAEREPGAVPAFRGVIVGVISPERIERAYRSMTTMPASTVTLLRDDRLVLARYPWDEELIGQPAPSVEKGRLVSVHAVPHQPLSVEVTVSEDAVLGPWRRQAASLALVTGAFLIGAGLLLRVLVRQRRAERRSRDALAERNAELEAAQARLERQASELAATAEALRGGERLLAERSATLDTALQHMDQGMLMVDASGTVAAYNHRVVEMMGLPEELLARRPHFSELLQFQWETGEFSRTGESLLEFVRGGGMLDQPQVYQRERPNGRTVEVRSLPLPGGGIVRTYSDITERKQAEARIERAALVDELTELPNRLALRQALERQLQEGAEGLALIDINLDRFRLLNDARGHETGDRLLIEVARRLRAALPAEDALSRTGGDEFAILHRARGGEEDPSALGERLLALLAEPHVINGLRLTVSASIGLALATDGARAETLMRNADIALNRAKDAGRNRLCRYEPAMAVAQHERFQVEQSLREALAGNAFRLSYQPIVEVDSNAVVGWEALLRWTDRVRGEMSPQDFIPVAEATGMIVPIGRFVLEAACLEAASWSNACSVAVNLSPAQFQDGALPETVRDILDRSGLAPERLELEVTEGLLLEDTGAVHDAILALRQMGVGLTLDDFGTGHAGLSYLRRFPFNKIKIDRSFIRNLGQDRESDAIVEAILLLGRRLDLRVVAEGVEHEAQLEQLRAMRCPYVQGYLTGRPVAAEIARAL